jgi:hypothetical protein
MCVGLSGTGCVDAFRNGVGRLPDRDRGILGLDRDFVFRNVSRPLLLFSYPLAGAGCAMLAFIPLSALQSHRRRVLLVLRPLFTLPRLSLTGIAKLFLLSLLR